MVNELLPTLQAEALKRGLVDYVSTAVHFSENHVVSTFKNFLEDPDHGIFKGPYVRTRLPFAAVNEEPVLDILPEWFSPYKHQAEAFRRLSTSPALEGERDRAGLRIPEPTIVTTGTGSGKTESFLYPMLDYAVRARKAGIHGIKAIILYPMNALANDQASRLARMIHENPALKGVTAGLYTGEGGSGSSSMAEDHLIEDRYALRNSSPDILLTNYKMLDQLLLRREDRGMWNDSASSLRYLALDEFHTYNGAQGTDVAMLIRRLKILLDRLSGGRSRLVPVATSATLGDKGDLAPVADFASTIFGSEFGERSVVTEERVDSEDLEGRARTALRGSGLEPVEQLGTYEVTAVLHELGLQLDSETVQLPTTSKLMSLVLGLLWKLPGGTDKELSAALDGQRTQNLLLAHPLIRRLLDATANATSIKDLGGEILGQISDLRLRERMIALLIAALSQARAEGERNEFPNVEAHLWVREIKRIDRATTSTAGFRWSDDSAVVDGTALPAVYCRRCGASGWGIQTTGTDQLGVDPDAIRQAKAYATGRFRALLYAPQEQGRTDGQTSERLRYLDPESRTLGAERPSESTADVDPLPVLTWVGLEADAHSNDDDCPVCEASNSIRFVGSAIATLLSVSLSSLFGTAELADVEKKSLVFTDSVQDAAHRAAFVESRSYALSFRSAVQNVLTDEPQTADDVAAALMDQAATDADRYRLLPATIARNAMIAPYWTPEASKEAKTKARDLVAKRLGMELDLEFGLISTYGRTLATTGAAVASVRAESDVLLGIGREVLERMGQSPLTQEDSPFQPDDRQTIAWVRGILERLRLEGAIAHDWLELYRKNGGGRYHIWGGRPHREAMRAFPAGASAPEFPYIGRLPESIKTGFTDAAGRRGRYARWTAHCLDVDTRWAAHLMTPLFEALVRNEVLDEIHVKDRKASARTFGLRRDRVVASRAHVPIDYLSCPVCGDEITGTSQVVTELTGAPCFAMACNGLYGTEQRDANYYRELYEGDMLRVISREHTSLLQAEARLEYETQFKSSDTTPGAPNVLVATPTLEMGIDIGDLSMVMLSSVPRSVASYLQRVGRAGRRTGNALDLTYVPADASTSTTGVDPTELINGSVRPPAAYLAAEEIVHRQFLAFLMDRLAGEDGVPVPGRMSPVLRSAGEGTFLGAVIQDVRDHAEERVDEFISSFRIMDLPRDGLTTSAAQALKRWALPAPGEQSDLEKSIYSAVQRWAQERDQLRYRLKLVQQRLQELKDGPHAPTDSEQEEIEVLKGQRTLLHQSQVAHDAIETEEAKEEREKDERRLTGQRKRLGRDKSEFEHQHWIGSLERFSLLPNFTLFDDSVDLDVTLTWREEDNTVHHIPQQYSRSGFGAITELAPGSHFYAQGLELIIDTVDLGHNGDNLRTFAFCPHCGHKEEPHDEQLFSCPRCSKVGIGDPGQSLDVVEFKKVSSTVDRNLSSIGDSTEERKRVHYETRLIPNFNDAQELDKWSIDGTGIGINYRRNTRLTTLNLGRAMDAGQTITLAGREERITGFLICAECGHKDENTGVNKPSEHQGWCSQRHVEKPRTVSAVLSREMSTESVLLTLPKSIGEDATGISLWSFGAAVSLGLKEMFGGEVGHIAYTDITDTARNNSRALLLYDQVPGGTGYLSELASASSLREIFLKAKDTLEKCSCASEEAAACHRCLLPHVPFAQRDQAHRGRALDILQGILNPDDDEHPEDEGAWQISREDPSLDSDIESKLESRFYRIFRAAVERISGAEVNDTMNDGGRGFSVFRNGLLYKFTQQVQLGDVMPDALISIPGNHGVSGVAIFLDGKAYHASSKVNRLSDDADKRQRLRDRGYLVYALTHQDLEQYEHELSRRTAVKSASSSAPDEDAVSRKNVPRSPLADLWSEANISMISKKAQLSDHVIKFFGMNPVDQLLALFEPPRPERPFEVQTKVATYFPYGLFDPRTPKRLPDDQSELSRDVRDSLEDSRSGSFGASSKAANGFARLESSLSLAAVLSGKKDNEHSFAAVLDDRPDAVTTEEFDLAWRRWLALSNLAQHPGAGTSTLQTWTSMATSEEADSDATNSLFDLIRGNSLGPADGTSAATTDAQEAPIPKEFQAAIGNAMDAAEAEALEAAARYQWPVPEQGADYGGIVVDLAWPDARIAWIADAASVRTAQTLTDLEGWTVVGPEPQDLVSILGDGLH